MEVPTRLRGLCEDHSHSQRFAPGLGEPPLFHPFATTERGPLTVPRFPCRPLVPEAEGDNEGDNSEDNGNEESREGGSGSGHSTPV